MHVKHYFILICVVSQVGVGAFEGEGSMDYRGAGGSRTKWLVGGVGGIESSLGIV